jgi:murein L,D-transpeptidase YcbB/YkuD
MGAWLVMLVRRVGMMVLAGTMLAGVGCHAKRKTRSAPKSDQFAGQLRPLVAGKQIQVMHWPNFADFGPQVQTFYDDRNYEVAWVEDDGKPSKQALAFIDAFRDAAKKGLVPEDYDAGLWVDRLKKLEGRNPDDVATFDATMTVNVIRLIHDLHVGRVNPTHFNFDILTTEKEYDLPTFVSDNAVDAADVPALLTEVEPDNKSYRALEDALAGYLAQQQAAATVSATAATVKAVQKPLPVVFSPVKAGGSYIGAPDLMTRLVAEGDMAPVKEEKRWLLLGGSYPYGPELSEGVKKYQAAHGLVPDGKLTKETITSLNAPIGPAAVDPNLPAEIAKIDDSLERWRWLPNEYVDAPLMVNLPEFVLRGYKPDKTLDFTMRVVVGRVVGEHQTPMFTHEMKYLIFRPYWTVPMSIIKKELTPHLEKTGVGYLAAKNFETVDTKGEPVVATAAQVERGGVMVREKPGPRNSLGLVKFMFPNEYDIYLHSTPEPQLFNRTRRDFSHGCVRVQKPDELAVWVLNRGGADAAAGTEWDLPTVQEAMKSGPDNKQVSLRQSIPIAIVYLTANVGDDGQVHFFDDIYGYDKKLEAVLAKGRPYPTDQVKVDPNAVGSPGDRN